MGFESIGKVAAAIQNGLEIPEIQNQEHLEKIRQEHPEWFGKYTHDPVYQKETLSILKNYIKDLKID